MKGLKMKRKSYLLTLIITVALLMSLFSVFALAADGQSSIPDTSSNQAQPADIEPYADVEEDSIQHSEYESIFAKVYEKISSYSAEILCTLTLIASLVVVFFYKKGLIPMLKNGIGVLCGTVKTLKDEASVQGENLNAFTETLNGKLALASGMLEKATASLDEVTKRLEGTEAMKHDTDTLKCVLLSEIDMLYDIFMSASLPQYEKDRIGERVGAMKASLCAEAIEDEA